MSEAFRYLIGLNGVKVCVLFKNIPEQIDDQIRWKNLILSLDYPYTYAEYVEFSKNWPVCLNLPDMTLGKLLTELSKFLPYTSTIGALSIFMKVNGQEDKLRELIEDLKDELIPSKDVLDVLCPLASLASEEPDDRENVCLDTSTTFLNLLDVPKEKRFQIVKMLKEVTQLPLAITVILLSPKNYDESDSQLELLLKNLPDYLLKYLPIFTGFIDKPKHELLSDILFIPELVTTLFHFENKWKDKGNTQEEINRKSEYFGELLEKFKRFRKIPYFIESDGLEETGIREEIELVEELNNFQERMNSPYEKNAQIEIEKTRNQFPLKRFLKFLEKNKFEEMTLEEMQIFLNGEKIENLLDNWSAYYDIPSNKKSARTSKFLNS